MPIDTLSGWKEEESKSIICPEQIFMPAEHHSTSNHIQETEQKPSLFRRVITRDSEYTTQEWKSVSHWFKQIVAVLLGLIWGYIPLFGIVAAALFVSPFLVF